MFFLQIETWYLNAYNTMTSACSSVRLLFGFTFIASHGQDYNQVISWVDEIHYSFNILMFDIAHKIMDD